LHFGTEWVQGAMRLRKPDAIELEYAQQMIWMLFNPEPQHIVQLGLGTGALTKFSYRQFETARVTAVELNPSVIAICESMFKLPANDDRLNVIEMDALDFLTMKTISIPSTRCRWICTMRPPKDLYWIRQSFISHAQPASKTTAS
jgi:spermidine synthase